MNDKVGCLKEMLAERINVAPDQQILIDQAVGDSESIGSTFLSKSSALKPIVVGRAMTDEVEESVEVTYIPAEGDPTGPTTIKISPGSGVTSIKDVWNSFNTENNLAGLPDPERVIVNGVEASWAQVWTNDCNDGDTLEFYEE